MTLREFDRFMTLLHFRHKRECFYAGIPASAVANYAGRMMKDGNTVDPYDFVPRSVEFVQRERKKAEVRDAMVVAFSLRSSVDRNNVLRSIVEDGFSEQEADKMLLELFPKWKVEN